MAEMQAQPAPAAGATLLLAGAPQLRRGPQLLSTGTRKALALAVMAALEPALHRSRAADLLWPDADPAAARRNVRRDLFRLRQAGLALVAQASGRLQLEGVSLEWPRPTPLPPLWLDGLDDVAGPEFAHWVAAARLHLQQRWLADLVAGARERERSGPPAAARQAWRALLADGAAGPAFAEALAAVQRLLPDEPEPAPKPLAAVAAGTRPPHLPFVARAAELAEVRAHLDQGQVVLIDGSPGIGKTRLALEALAARGATLVMRCRPEDSATPYASALRGLQAARDAAAQTSVPAWARRDLAALVPDWAGRSAHLSERPELLAPTRLRRAYRAALRALTAGSFDGLVIDDWQWADEASRELWELVDVAGATAAALPPCVIVHRSAELPPAALQRRRGWADAGLAATVTLRPLADSEAHALLAALLPLLSPGGGPALDTIVTRCAGNPLFLIEILRHGAPGHGPLSAPAPEDADAAPMPPGVRDIILARARALGPAVRRVLEAASLAGDALAPRLLAGAVGMDELDVAHALEHAASAELLLADSGGRHRYAHELYAQVIADSLSPVRRAALHRQLAAALAAQAAEPGHVAWHLDRADHPAEAAPWHLRAAELALQRQAWEAAASAGAAALQASTDPTQRVQARLLLALALQRLADPAAAEATLHAAWADAVRAGATQVAELCLARAELHTATSRAPLALQELATLEADPALSPAQQRRLLQLRASALGYLGRHHDALPQLQRLLQELPPSALTERLSATHTLARNAYWAGQLENSRSYVESALELASRIGDEVSIARCLQRLGALHRDCGDVASAEARLREATELARRVGHTEILRSALCTRATILLDALHLDEAEALIIEGEQAAPFWETPDLEDVYDERRFRLCYLRGDVAAAWQVIERSLARHGGGHLHSQLGTLVQATRLALATGETARAHTLLDEARRLHAAAGADSLHGRELEALAVELLRAQGHALEACAAAQAWLAAPGPQRVEEHARLLAAAAGAAMDLHEPARASAWLAQAQALRGVTNEIEALLLMARLRLASVGQAGAEDLHAVQADAQRWLASGALPALESAWLRQALHAHAG